MIRRVSLTNYGPFASAELELAPLTVVVGPNASGKSKLLELLGVAAGESAPLNTFLLGRKRKGAKGKAEFALDPSGEKLFTVFLQMNPEALRSASYIDSDEPLIHGDGYGLATNLAYLKLNDSDAFARLLAQTRSIVPTFENLRFRRAKVSQFNGGEVYGDELVFDMKSAPDLTPDAVSDGTLLTLGLLTCTMEFTRRHKAESGHLLFLIDDVERGLHPRALAELVGQLRRLTETTGAQILATSHSPYLLDALEPEEVRLTGFLEDGSVTIKPLTAHPDFERWKDEMTPGEIWSMVGEDWIK